MLESLKPGMTKPEPVRCPDGHFRRAVYGIGPYIADYPEQALLACIVQNWCPKYLSDTTSFSFVHSYTYLDAQHQPAILMVTYMDVVPVITRRYWLKHLN